MQVHFADVFAELAYGLQRAVQYLQITCEFLFISYPYFIFEGKTWFV